MNYKCIPTLLLAILFTVVGYSQSLPSFAPFKGEIFEIPMKAIKLGYGDHVADYPKIGTLEWSKINVPERSVDDGFPDVSREDRFAIDFKSTITIHQAGCYAFSLKSDDGSLLWIDEELIVDNTGEDQRIGTVDTAYFEKNAFPLRIWYSQIYPDRHGIVFKAHKVEGACENKHKFSNPKKTAPTKPTIAPVAAPQKKVSLTGTLLFDTNAFVLKEEAHPQLDALCAMIATSNPSSILIVGHTDNVGQFNDNLALSIKRASAVKAYLQAKTQQHSINYTVKGMGDQQPIAPNTSELGKQKNRRVDVILQ